MTPSQTAKEFVRAINARSVPEIVALMSNDHVFIDSLGIRVKRPAIELGWQQYFAMVPDFGIRVDEVIAKGEVAVLFGAVGGTYLPKNGTPSSANRWEAPAAWRAVVCDGKISEWRIYCDNEPMREKIRAAAK